MRLLKLLTLGVAVVLAMAVVIVLGRTAVRAQTRERPVIDVQRLMHGGAQLGMRIRDVDDADVRREKLADRTGAVVEDVEANGPAARAGLKAGDVIVTFDGERVRSARHLSRLIDESPEGRDIETVVVRNGERVTLKATPEASRLSWYPLENLQALRNWRIPDRFEMRVPDLTLRNWNFAPLVPLETRARLGVTVMELTGQLGDFFGTTRGVLVTEVDDDTPAKRAGLRAGDVITRVDGHEVNTSGELRQRLTSATGDVQITIVRDRKEQTLTAKIEDPVEADPRRPRVIRRTA